MPTTPPSEPPQPLTPPSEPATPPSEPATPTQREVLRHVMNSNIETPIKANIVFNIVTSNTKNLYQHENSSHWTEQLDEEGGSFSCKKCSRGFAQKANAKNHILNNSCVKKIKIKNQKTSFFGPIEWNYVSLLLFFFITLLSFLLLIIITTTITDNFIFVVIVVNHIILIHCCAILQKSSTKTCRHIMHKSSPRRQRFRHDCC